MSFHSFEFLKNNDLFFFFNNHNAIIMPYTINTNSFELSNTDKQVFPNRSCLHRLDHIQIEQNWYSFLSAYCNHLGELKKKKKKAPPQI